MDRETLGKNYSVAPYFIHHGQRRRGMGLHEMHGWQMREAGEGEATVREDLWDWIKKGIIGDTNFSYVDKYKRVDS